MTAKRNTVISTTVYSVCKPVQYSWVKAKTATVIILKLSVIDYFSQEVILTANL